MDNLFDYIVITFFVVSAIASIMKKKKKAQEKEAANAQTVQKPVQSTSPPIALRVPTQRTESEPVKTQKQKVSDPFEEVGLFGAIKVKDEINQQEKQPSLLQEFKSEVDNYFEAALKKSQEAEKGTSQPVARRSLIQSSEDDSQTQSPVKSDTSHSLFKESAIVDIHLQGGKIKNKRADDIRKIMRSNTELKTMIVISELLNKPKALRRQ